MPKQLHITPVDPAYPPYLYGPYLNIKAGVSNVLADAAEDASLRVRGFKGTTAGKRKQVKDFKGPNRWLDIPGQLEALGLGTFCGRQHSGIDVRRVLFMTDLTGRYKHCPHTHSLDRTRYLDRAERDTTSEI